MQLCFRNRDAYAAVLGDVQLRRSNRHRELGPHHVICDGEQSAALIGLPEAEDVAKKQSGRDGVHDDVALRRQGVLLLGQASDQGSRRGFGGQVSNQIGYFALRQAAVDNNVFLGGQAADQGGRRSFGGQVRNKTGYFALRQAAVDNGVLLGI